MAPKKTAQEQDRSIKTLESRIQALETENEALKQTVTELQGRLNPKKELQERLSLSEDKYRGIIESIQEGYFETDLEGHITFCNQALLDIAGYSRKDLIGATFQTLAPPRTARAMRSIFGRVFKSGQDANACHYEVFHKDGRTLIIEFAAGCGSQAFPAGLCLELAGLMFPAR